MDAATLYRTIVEEAPDGIWVYDLDGRTVYANRHIATMFEIDDAELPDLSILDFLDDVGQSQFREHLEGLREGRSASGDVECRFVRRNGTTFWVLVNGSPVSNEDGSIAAIVSRVTDYSERRMTVDELRVQQRRLAAAQRIARIGSWTWDVVRDELHPSAELISLYGLEAREFPVPFASFLESVHRDDRSRVEDALAAVRAGGSRFVFTARVRGPRGWVWTRGRGEATRDETGDVVSMSGTHQDINDAKQAELALVDSLQQNAVLQAVATAANEAATLREALADARSLVLGHEDLVRGRAFLPVVDEDTVTPLYIEESDWTADLTDPTEAAIEHEVATSAYRLGRPVWDRRRLTIAFPVSASGEVHAVLTITAAPPLRRHEMMQSLVEQLSVQLGRVAERERSQRELADARDAAMEASRQKSEFLATMSHEIRTPLNGVIGLNELLLRTPLDDTQERLAAGVQVASRALLAVLNDILDFSKIEAGELRLEEVDFEVHPVFTQVVDVLGQAATSKGVALTVTVEPSVPAYLRGDPTKLGQVLSNLVSNAIKFTDRGEVDVCAMAHTPHPERVQLEVRVTDTGVGIDEHHATALFNPFTQADASTTRLYGGTGLGLAISKQIVEAYGGELHFEPNPRGGSIFHFTAELALPSLTAIGELDAASSPRRSSPEAPPRAEGRSRVLVVEDNLINQLVATGLLEAQGYAVEVADDGVAALEKLRERRFDAVLMDVQMPRLDGYATTRTLRRNPGPNQRIPVVAMTAAAIEGERERCLDAGMDDFLTKPVDPAALAQVMAEWIETQVPDSSAGSAGPADRPAAQSAGRRPLPIDPAEIPGLDVTRLDMLRDLDPDSTDYLDRAIGNFLRNSLASVDGMREAIEAGDAAALRYVSHKLVGSALNLGAVEAGEAVRRIEWIADTGTVEGAAEALPAVASALERGRTSLRAYLERYLALAGGSVSSDRG